MNEKINYLRKRIDWCDSQMLSSLQERFEHVKNIGEIKKESNLPIIDDKRFQEIINNWTYIFEGKLDETFIKKLFQLIHEESIRIQQNL